MMVGSQKSTFEFRKRLIYLAGPLTDDDETIQRNNILFAVAVAAELRSRGCIVVSPHEMGYHHPESLTYEGWMTHGLEILKRCDWLILLPGWEWSKGTKREVEYAKKVGLVITEHREIAE